MKYFLIDLKKAEDDFSAIIVKTSSKIRVCTNKKIKKVKKLCLEDIVLDNRRILSVSEIHLPFKIKKLNSKTCIKVPSIQDLRIRLDAIYPNEPWNTKLSQDILKSFFVVEVYKEFLGVSIRTSFNQKVYLSGSLITENYIADVRLKNKLQKSINSLEVASLI